MNDTPVKTVRMDDLLWRRFGDHARDRSAVIRQFIHWYIGDEGWPAPRRPVDGRSAEPDQGAKP